MHYGNVFVDFSLVMVAHVTAYRNYPSLPWNETHNLRSQGESITALHCCFIESKI